MCDHETKYIINDINPELEKVLFVKSVSLSELFG